MLLTALLFAALAASAQDAPGRVAPGINPELREHTRHFERKVYKIADNVYSAVGWDLANTILVEGTNGVIIVDTGGGIGSAREVEKELRKITGKPVVAVIYTHFHPDHINGVKAYATDEDVKAGRVAIYAHEMLLQNVQNQSAVIGPILGMRSAYSFGAALDAEDMKEMNGGIGPNAHRGSTAAFIAPTRTFKDKLEVTLAGVRMQMLHVPSEAPDEIAIFLPQNKVLLSAEVIQGPTLPNIHTLRGTSFRDPVKWFRSIDALRSFKAEHLVPAHGQPVSGADKVEEVLRMYRGGIQFVHDQTIRYMNKGLTPDELANTVKFPPHLANFKPYLREYYGTVKHSVRQIYQGYLGWFEGDPVELDPVPRAESARRHVALMGGRDRVLAEARKADESGDAQWAAELATYLIRIDHNDKEARQVKATAFRKLGYAQMNINWRNWYLMSARELEGTLDLAQLSKAIAQVFSSPDLVAAFPARAWVEGFSIRLKAEQTNEVQMTMGFVFPDVNESYALEIRRGVAQFHERMPEKTDATLTLNKGTLNRVLLQQVKFQEAAIAGEIRISSGTPADVQRFFSYFEPPLSGAIELTVR
ncbi:MAG TPA: alkyl sulfatase dimerization domain-containing protein [Blastocatellia bacterium]|nr:alkyl sulfatase dimerization domain-containing protein [Blastocatellia bacterium]